jgi:DHA2 family multidrug resistance protein
MDQPGSSHKWPIILTVMTGSLMASLDTSIVNVAIPNMRGSLGASVEEMTWVPTGYILSAVIIMPLIALMSSRFGRKRFYMFSVFLFTMASMLCGIAWDLPSMVTFRILQGIGGGTLVPVAQAILRETLTPEERGKAMGIYGFGVVLGPAIGPTLGGWLTDNFSWQWIFYINVPVGIVNMLMLMWFIEDPPYLVRHKGKLDLSGLLLMTIGLGALQIMLEKGQRKDWFNSDIIIWLAVIACAGLVLFVWRELSADNPAVNLRILKNRNFTLATFLGGVLGLCLFGSLFIMPLFLQSLLSYPAYDSGLVMLPRAAFMALSMPLAGRLYLRIGPRVMVAMGMTANIISFYRFSNLSLDVGYWDLFIPQCLQGLGFGFIFVSVSAAGLSSIEKELMTAATGLYNVVRQVFGSIGIALSSTLLTRGESWNRGVLIDHITSFGDRTAETLHDVSSFLVSQGMDRASADAGSLKVIEELVMKHASMLSFNRVFYVIAVLFLLCMPLIVFLKDVRISPRKKTVARWTAVFLGRAFSVSRSFGQRAWAAITLPDSRSRRE